MRECICNSCKNLKNVIDETDLNHNGITADCEFGYPSEACWDCEAEGCELTCEHYEEDVETEPFVILKCAKCGQEVKHTSSSNEESEIYCITCYLNK